MFWTDNCKQSFIFLVPCFLLGLLVKWDHCHPRIRKRLIRCFCFGIVWSTVIRFDPELFRCMCKKCNGYLALCLNLVFGWRGPLVQHSNSRTSFAKYSKGFIFAHTAWLRLLVCFFFFVWCYCQTSHKTRLLQLLLESCSKLSIQWLL